MPELGVMFQGHVAMLGFIEAYMAAPSGADWGADIGVVHDHEGKEPPFVIIAAVVNEDETTRYAFSVSEWDALRLRVLKFIDLFHRNSPPQVLAELVDHMGDVLVEAMKVQKNMKAGMH